MKEFDSLESFLEHVSLATSVDQEWDGEKINMMTMHAAKGLEFDVVFLPGWEEGLFPHQKSIEEKGQNGLEEERRLAYVGITRAKQKLCISFSIIKSLFLECNIVFVAIISVNKKVLAESIRYNLRA